MVLGRASWERLLTSKRITNRLNAACAYLTMLAGTGPDNATTSWSARSFETYLGMRKANGQRAISQLVDIGLAIIEKAGARPRYKLTNAPAKEADDSACIFLPNQMVTGLGDAPPLLRRLRETGDILPLQLLISIYGEVQDDLTYGLDAALRGEFRPGHDHPVGPDRKFGANSIWLVEPCSMSRVEGKWWQPAGPDGVWPQIKTLESLKALSDEPWLFSGPDTDADPLCPWNYTIENAHRNAAMALCKFEHWSNGAVPVVLASHMPAPAVRSVYRPTIMADTPRRRMRFVERQDIENAVIARLMEIEEGANNDMPNVVPFSTHRRAS